MAQRNRFPIPLPILVLLVAAAATIGYTALAPSATAATHPEPRAGVSAETLQPPARYASNPQIAQVYAEVAKIPQIVDGLYCNCHCAEHSGHYSLLSCFESDHGARCDICLGSAHLAYTLALQGATLDEIRLAIDNQFG
ncbi:MAG TPA: PCYCGC motif-containing (lipo)protein [Longimicrobiaceae bacterium]|nr:PCYCGC motif-containing (lipo)protein [Longimicrobiaceae bacterium]